ncbi:optic atrophy 3-like protein, partial [Ramicandelaber brevisporus]
MSTFKLGALLIRTLSKPIANNIKQRTKSSPGFKSWCINVAQWSHRVEMNLKMKFLGYEKEHIRPLNDARAIEAGANFLSEAFIFSVAALILVAENQRTRYVARKNKNQVDDNLQALEDETKQLRETVTTMQGRYHQLKSEMGALREE